MRCFQTAATGVRALAKFGPIGALAFIASHGALAQQPAGAVHRIGPSIHATTEALGMRVGVRPLTDGRVLVSDPQNSRLLMFDSTLEHATVVADTTAATGKAWGKGLAGLIEFAGDSSLARDVLTGAYVVIDPAGTIVRVIPAPAKSLTIGEQTLGEAIGYDHAGHLLFRAARPVFLLLLDPDFVGDTLMKGPDLMPILRRDLVTGIFDTLVMVRAQATRQAVRRRAQGGGSGRSAFNPISSADDWTVLDDGTVAVVKIADYHVEWVSPDRTVRSTGKVPATWVPISPAQKAAMIDTLRVRDSVLAAGRSSAPSGIGAPSAVIEPSDLPDFWPPFVTELTIAAPEGAVWVHEGRVPQSPGLPIYDVISHQGTLIDRVQLPGGQSLAAVGRDRVYLVDRMNGRSRVIEASKP